MMCKQMLNCYLFAEAGLRPKKTPAYFVWYEFSALILHARHSKQTSESHDCAHLATFEGMPCHKTNGL